MDSAQRRLVATMPLHAITSTYGEEGLRERFAAEAALFSEEDRRRLNRALELAARLHAGDRREREPYVNHLLRVAIRIMSHYGVRDTDVICAALLHDAVEDHPAELAASAPGDAGVAAASALGDAGVADASAPGDAGADAEQGAALAALAAGFGPRVAGLVAAVTNPRYAPGRDAHEQYREHVANSLRRSPWARVIKASDFTDNGVGLIHSTGSRLSKLAGKYAPLVPILRELIELPDTPLDAAARQHILSQLDRAAERFAAVLSAGEAHGGG
jgi:HD domain